MPKKLSEKQKTEILELFREGIEPKDIAIKYNFANSTIVRQLKILLGNDTYLKLKENQLSSNSSTKEKFITDREEVDNNQFFEVIPLIEGVELNTQKDLTSLSIQNFNFPEIVYMIVDNKIELETKLLKEFPDWSFLSQDEQDRKTIQIYFDLKNAKRICNKDQKVIKIPNTEVFKIVAPILKSRGISRIVSEDKLIAL